MSKMVERVAQEISRVVSCGNPYDIAEAALEVMREPTPAQLYEARLAVEAGATPEQIWRSMIDTALIEVPTEP